MKFRNYHNVAILLWMACTVVHAKEPCPYEDTVDLTNATKLDSGYYSYNGVVLAPHEIAEYSYVINFKNENVAAPKHLRGCVCSKRTCIPLCCKNAEECLPNTLVANISIGGNIVEKLIKDEFIIQIMKPSQQESLYILDDPFIINENGSIEIDDFGLTNKNDYCLENSNGQLLIIQYASNFVYDDINNIISYVTLASVPFMLITICVYLYIAQLRKAYGKYLSCYLIGLSVGYTLLNLRNTTIISSNEILCKISGYISYYFFLTAFFWLTVISFDIFSNFRASSRRNEHKSFSIYATYAYGIPLVFLIITISAQELKFCPDYLKPGISTENGCWLNNTESLPPFIFFFGPMLLLIASNLYMFIMTAYRIYVKDFGNKNPGNMSARHFRKARNSYWLYLRLFIMMGVCWLLELANHFSGQSEQNSKIFIVFDLFNAMQGVIIFILFVMIKRVRILMMIKIFKRNGSYHMPSENSTQTTQNSVIKNAINIK